MTDGPPTSDSSGNVTTPRWVKAFVILFAFLVLLVVVMVLAGGHGPGLHTP